MFWVEHYNTCVERKDRELRQYGYSHSFPSLSFEFDAAAETSTDDIQNVCTSGGLCEQLLTEIGVP
jgi:hypothetical protein